MAGRDFNWITGWFLVTLRGRGCEKQLVPDPLSREALLLSWRWRSASLPPARAVSALYPSAPRERLECSPPPALARLTADCGQNSGPGKCTPGDRAWEGVTDLSPNAFGSSIRWNSQLLLFQNMALKIIFPLHPWNVFWEPLFVCVWTFWSVF